MDYRVKPGNDDRGKRNLSVRAYRRCRLLGRSPVSSSIPPALAGLLDTPPFVPVGRRVAGETAEPLHVPAHQRHQDHTVVIFSSTFSASSASAAWAAARRAIGTR